MKKTIALLLATLMLVFTFAVSFVVFADDTRVELSENLCEFCGQPHTSYDEATGTIGLYSCRCCLQCDYLDNTALTKCARNNEGHYSGFKCCKECTGFFPCLCNETNPDCDCVYCGAKAQKQDQGPVEVVPAKAKNIFTNVFTNVMGKLSEVFSNLFKVIFAIFGVED